MSTEAIDVQRADNIFRFGPETLAARSFAIYAGPVERYNKQVTEMAQPGPDAFPAKWVVAGRVEPVRVLKGSAPPADAVPFMRQEETDLLLLQAPPVAAWESALGELQPGDEAVLFFHGDAAKPALKVLPSRSGTQDLATLVHDVVAIQALTDANERRAAWLRFLAVAHTDEARQTALRSLVADPHCHWPVLQAAIAALLKQPALSPGMRAFATGIVAFLLLRDQWGQWGADQAAALDFLCRQFEATQDPWLSLQQVLSLKLVLHHLSAEAGAPAAASATRALRQRIFQALKQRTAAGALAPAVQQQIEQIRSSYAEPD